MTVHLTIPAEGSYSDIERDFIDNEPPGLFPEDQYSYWGQVRKVFADYLQVIVDQQTEWYNNLDPRTVDDNDIANWEAELGIPIAPTGKTLAQRRLYVQSRRKQGAFTRTRRREIVESFITATFGDSIAFDPTGVPFTAGGTPFFSGSFSLAGTYNIVENITAFTYDVRILDTITVDTAGLTRELDHITPAGITYTITSTPTP